MAPTTYVKPDSVLARTAQEVAQAHAGGRGPSAGMTICPLCAEPLPCSAARAAAEVLLAAGLALSSGLVEASRQGLGPDVGADSGFDLAGGRASLPEDSLPVTPPYLAAPPYSPEPSSSPAPVDSWPAFRAGETPEFGSIAPAQPLGWPTAESANTPEFGFVAGAQPLGWPAEETGGSAEAGSVAAAQPPNWPAGQTGETPAVRPGEAWPGGSSGGDLSDGGFSGNGLPGGGPAGGSALPAEDEPSGLAGFGAPAPAGAVLTKPDDGLPGYAEGFPPGGLAASRQSPGAAPLDSPGGSRLVSPLDDLAGEPGGPLFPPPSFPGTAAGIEPSGRGPAAAARTTAPPPVRPVAPVDVDPLLLGPPLYARQNRPLDAPQFTPSVRPEPAEQPPAGPVAALPPPAYPDLLTPSDRPASAMQREADDRSAHAIQPEADDRPASAMPPATDDRPASAMQPDTDDRPEGYAQPSGLGQGAQRDPRTADTEPARPEPSQPAQLGRTTAPRRPPLESPELGQVNRPLEESTPDAREQQPHPSQMPRPPLEPPQMGQPNPVAPAANLPDPKPSGLNLGGPGPATGRPESAAPPARPHRPPLEAPQLGQLNRPLEPAPAETAAAAGPDTRSGLPAAPAQAATRQPTYQPGAFTTDRPASSLSGLPGLPPAGAPGPEGRPSGLQGITGPSSGTPSGLPGQPSNAPSGLPGQPTTGQPVGDAAPVWPAGKLGSAEAAPSGLPSRPDEAPSGLPARPAAESWKDDPSED
jgi:hypothetical protein